MKIIRILSAYTTIDIPYLVTFLITTPTFEWYVNSYGFKNGYQNHMYLKEIRLITYLKFDCQSRLNQSTYLVKRKELGRPIRPSDDHKNIHFNNELMIFI